MCYNRTWDLSMKQITNGKERGIDDWTHLVSLADPGLKILGVKSPPGSFLSIIEVAWVGKGS
jgi:hypothetical protein